MGSSLFNNFSASWESLHSSSASITRASRDRKFCVPRCFIDTLFRGEIQPAFQSCNLPRLDGPKEQVRGMFNTMGPAGEDTKLGWAVSVSHPLSTRSHGGRKSFHQAASCHEETERTSERLQIFLCPPSHLTRRSDASPHLCSICTTRSGVKRVYVPCILLGSKHGFPHWKRV